MRRKPFAAKGLVGFRCKLVFCRVLDTYSGAMEKCDLNRVRVLERALSWFLILGTCLFVFSCAKPSLPKVSTQEAPSWVKRGSGLAKEGERIFFCGVGSAPVMKMVAMQRTIAQGRARKQLHEGLKTFLQSVTKDYIPRVYGSDDEPTEEDICKEELKRSLDVDALKLSAEWLDEKDQSMYALYEWDLDKATEFLSNRKPCANMRKKVVHWLQRGATHFFQEAPTTP